MAENREYLTQIEENGSINISEEVVASVVADAMKEIEGVGAMGQNMTEQFSGRKSARGVHAELQDGGIMVDVYLMVRYGYAIPEVAQKVQDCVGSVLSDMTGFPVKAVNVHVAGISFN